MKSILVFFISVLSSLTFLFLERLIGINWDYHPDADTYVNTYQSMSMVLLEGGFLGWFNNSYYLVCFLFNGSIVLLTTLNIIAYAFTNVVFFNFFFNFSKENVVKKNVKIFFYLWIFIFPYRLHLSVHILKDSLIILAYTIITSRFIFRNIAWLPLLLIRVFSVFYLIPILPAKYLRIVVLIMVLVLLLFPTEIFLLLTDKNDVSMTFREFDAVPTFSQYGTLGIFIRAIVWPIITLSGLFFILSPSIAFFPIAVGIVLTQIWSKKVLGQWAFTVGVFLAFAAIACVVNGYTSYIRYTFPMVVVLPLLLLSNVKSV